MTSHCNTGNKTASHNALQLELATGTLVMWASGTHARQTSARGRSKHSSEESHNDTQNETVTHAKKQWHTMKQPHTKTNNDTDDTCNETLAHAKKQRDTYK